MALLYPKTPKTQTLGEQKVLTCLQQNLSDAWHIFYEPILGDARPDIVLYCPFYGAMVIEVKDYTEKTIKHLAIDSWSIHTENGIKNITSPLKQVADYAYSLINILEKNSVCTVSEGTYQGRLRFPIVYVCWFVNLDLNELDKLSISKVIPENRLLSKDDLKVNESVVLRITNKLVSKFNVTEIGDDVTEFIVSTLYPEFEFPSFNEERASWFDRFKCNIQFFPSVTDEILFIATEIRNLYAKGYSLDQVHICYNENRQLKKASLENEMKGILKTMGVPCAALNEGNGVRILPLSEFKYESGVAVIFVPDIKPSNISKKNEAALKLLQEDVSIHKYYTSSNYF